MTKKPKFKSTDNELMKKFHEVDDFETLGNLLELNPFGLKRIFYEIRRQEKHYHEFSIEKKGGGIRQIFAPDYPLKAIQRRISYVLSLIYLDRPSVHGFIKGKNIITNAEQHTRKRLLLNIDLENFFPTIHFGRVRGRLESNPYNLTRSGATIIAGLCCYKSKLPQGGPTSPIISNMICSGLDYELQLFANNEHCTYSRYADDLVFSTTRGSFSPDMMENLNAIINKHGFKINEKKTRSRFLTERQEVTGLVVNKFVNIKREFIKEVRIMLHIWNKFGLENARGRHAVAKGNDFYEVLRGKINFIKQVKSKTHSTYSVLAKKFNTLAKEPIFEIVPIKNWPEDEYFSAGEMFKGINFIREILSRAETEIFILDNYLDAKIIGLIEERIIKNPGLSIKLFITKENKNRYNECVLRLKEFVANHPQIIVDCRKGQLRKWGKLHGRYIIIDGTEIYGSGSSFGQLGEKADRIARLHDENEKKRTLADNTILFDGALKLDLINFVPKKDSLMKRFRRWRKNL